MIFVACDHAGLDLKKALIAKLVRLNWQDLGTHSSESCDYPDLARACAEKIVENPAALGILICGTGIGMSIAANKIHGVRAAAVSEIFSARMAREHNQAQILCLGSRVVEVDRAVECVEAFINAKVDSSERHARRVAKIMSLEDLSGAENEKRKSKSI